MSKRPSRDLGFDLTDERLCRIAWGRLAEPTDLLAQKGVHELGAAAALAAVAAGEGEARWRARLDGLDPLNDLECAARDGARLIIPGDAEWPTAIDVLGPARPFCLWVRGPLDLATACARAAAIVGARAATTYGERVAVDLAAGCAERGVAVVSGAAFGIDAAAHRGALGREGPTIAVLACGVERAYPRGNDRLIARIAAQGCVVSEVPPGTMPTRWRFLERNRIIAALAGVVVIVEAGYRSGSLGTAGRAGGLGITVAAVPGPVTSPMSYGTHRLLREGAVCVTSADEVVELVDPIGTSPAAIEPVPRAVHDGLSGADLQVFDALPLRKGVPLISISRVAGLDPALVRAGLGRLELSGRAERHGEGWRRGTSSKAIKP